MVISKVSDLLGHAAVTEAQEELTRRRAQARQLPHVFARMAEATLKAHTSPLSTFYILIKSAILLDDPDHDMELVIEAKKQELLKRFPTGDLYGLSSILAVCRCSTPATPGVRNATPSPSEGA